MVFNRVNFTSMVNRSKKKRTIILSTRSVKRRVACEWVYEKHQNVTRIRARVQARFLYVYLCRVRTMTLPKRLEIPKVHA